MHWDDRIAHRVKLRDLHYLLTVVQAGSMAKAAPLLRVSQPVISKAIADLEHMLGVRLLDRSPRGVEPTIFGRRLLASSHAIFDELRQGVKEIEHLSDPTAGELTIGSNEASMLGIVPTVIEKMRHQHPHIVIHVVLANATAEQHRELRERRIEFSIGRIGPSAPGEEFDTEVLFDQQLFVVAGTHNPWTRRRRVKLAQLMDGPWVLPPNDSVAGLLAAEVFRASGLSMPRTHVVTSSFQLNHHLLEDGPFLSLLPASVLPSLTKNAALKVVPVSLPSQSGPVGIIKLKNRTLGPVAKLFIESARSIAEAMP